MSPSKVEKIKIEGIRLNELLSEEFVEEFKELDEDLEAINLSLFSHSKNEMIGIFHENSEEIEEKELHIDSNDSELIELIQNILAED